MEKSTRAASIARTRALVVDDDPIIRSLLRSRLAHIVDEVVEASDGLEAWRLLSDTRFHLALVDLMMPGINGFSLIQCMRGHRRTRHMPIVVISSNDDRHSIQLALEAGASSFITKPVMWTTFRPHIEHLLRLTTATETAETALARLQALSDAQGQVCAAMAAHSHATSRSFATLAGRIASGDAQGTALVEVATVAAQHSAKLRAGHGMIASADVVNSHVHDVSALIRCAQLNMSDALDLREIAVGAWTCIDFDLLCSPDAMTYTVSVILGILADRAVPGSTIGITHDVTPDTFSLCFRMDAGRWSGFEPDELAVDLALAALQPRPGSPLDIALVRVLMAAHGGSIEVTGDRADQSEIWLRLPVDRAHRRASTSSVSEMENAASES